MELAKPLPPPSGPAGAVAPAKLPPPGRNRVAGLLKLTAHSSDLPEPFGATALAAETSRRFHCSAAASAHATRKRRVSSSIPSSWSARGSHFTRRCMRGGHSRAVRVRDRTRASRSEAQRADLLQPRASPWVLRLEAKSMRPEGPRYVREQGEDDLLIGIVRRG